MIPFFLTLRVHREGLKSYGPPSRGSGRGAPTDDGEFSKICKIFLTKIAKNQYFRLFYKDTSKHCIKLSRVWMKNTTGWGNFAKILKSFNENSIERLNFYLFLEIFLLEIEVSEIASFFTTNFPVREGVEPP